jgi:hypothetical protein
MRPYVGTYVAIANRYVVSDFVIAKGPYRTTQNLSCRFNLKKQPTIASRSNEFVPGYGSYRIGSHGYL